MLSRGPLPASDRQRIREALARVPDLDEVIAAELELQQSGGAA